MNKTTSETENKCFTSMSGVLKSWDIINPAADTSNEQVMSKVELNENVRVVVRCRPMNGKERSYGYSNVVVIKKVNIIEIVNPKYNELDCKSFKFDAVYDWNTSQEDLYKGSVQPIIDAVMKGFNGTILAYGQTGTGKTYTMEGNQVSQLEGGVIPKTFNHIYHHISQSNNEQYLVRASYVEIYQEEVKDLLSETNRITYKVIGDESGISIKGVKSHICKDAKEMEDVMKYGKKNRKVGATDMNEHSSRSHAIFIITVEVSKSSPGNDHIVVGKLNLVDLAGSERQVKTCTSGERLKEACKINLSLSALGNVVSALSTGNTLHVPYRESKLTRLLQDSLGGNSKTLMIVNIGPASYNYEESLTTLRYANRAKKIKNKPVINEDPKDALIKQYQEEIIRLKSLLQSKHKKNEKPQLTTYNFETDKECTNTILSNDTDSSYSVQVNDLAITSLSDDEKLKQLNKPKQQHKLLVEKKTYINETLERQIYSMQSKILQGTSLEKHSQNLKVTLKRQDDELKKATDRKLMLKLKLGKTEETTEELYESQTNLRKEIENKKTKIDSLNLEIQNFKEKTKKLIEEYNSDRNELQLSLTHLNKVYKLNKIIIDNCIPKFIKKHFHSIVCYDELNETCKVDYSKNTKYVLRNIKYNTTYPTETGEPKLLVNINYTSKVKNNNIISLGLEMPIRNVSEYTRPTVPTEIKRVIQNTLNTVEEDIIVDAKMTIMNNSLAKHSTTHKSVIDDMSKSVVYPKVRGLVKRK